MEMEILCRNGGVGLERMVASVMEALVVETALVVGKSVMWLLLAMGLLSKELTLLPREIENVNERDTLAILSRSTARTAPENRDDGETDDDDDDDDDAEEKENDGGEDDLSGDEGHNEGDDDDDPDDEVEANGEGGSDDEDDEDDDEDDDDDDGEDEDEDEEEDEEEDEDEEVPQPPAKKRK